MSPGLSNTATDRRRITSRKLARVTVKSQARKGCRGILENPISGGREFAVPSSRGRRLRNKKTLSRQLRRERVYPHSPNLPIVLTYFTTVIVILAVCPLPPVAVATTTAE
jgi:hypothetical protein